MLALVLAYELRNSRALMSPLALRSTTVLAVAAEVSACPSSSPALMPADPFTSTVLMAAKSCAAVWSAVAPVSMPSSLVPSVATSRPSTVPRTPMILVRN